MAGDLEHDTANFDKETARGFVDRLFHVEREFADQKAEYTDSKKDLKAEINGRKDETGIDFKRIESLVKIRLDEAKAQDEKMDRDADMFLYEQIFGFASRDEAPVDDEEEEDPLA